MRPHARSVLRRWGQRAGLLATVVGLAACASAAPESGRTPADTTAVLGPPATTAAPPATSAPEPTSPPPTTTAATTTVVTVAPTTTAAPAPPSSGKRQPSTTAPRPRPTSTAAPPPTTRSTGSGGFTATVSALDASQRAAMTGVSWHQGCPVSLDALRAVRLAYWGFDGAAHTGTLIVAANATRAITSAFGRLFAAHFPIAQITPIDAYGGDDDRSTAANNTSAFNCRPITAGRTWSQHAYGTAVDINPVQNPYVRRDGSVLDPNAARYTDRSLTLPGMIHSGDAVTSAFAAVGWGWGGRFSSIKDYQHFSASGG